MIFLDFANVSPCQFVVGDADQQDSALICFQCLDIPFFLNLLNSSLGILIPFQFDDNGWFFRMSGTGKEHQIDISLAGGELSYDIIKAFCAIVGKGNRLGHSVFIIILQM